jgi:hypothetical protein
MRKPRHACDCMVRLVDSARAGGEPGRGASIFVCRALQDSSPCQAARHAAAWIGAGFARERGTGGERGAFALTCKVTKRRVRRYERADPLPPPPVLQGSNGLTGSSGTPMVATRVAALVTLWLLGSSCGLTAFSDDGAVAGPVVTAAELAALQGARGAHKHRPGASNSTSQDRAEDGATVLDTVLDKVKQVRGKCGDHPWVQWVQCTRGWPCARKRPQPVPAQLPPGSRPLDAA